MTKYQQYLMKSLSKGAEATNEAIEKKEVKTKEQAQHLSALGFLMAFAKEIIDDVVVQAELETSYFDEPTPIDYGSCEYCGFEEYECECLDGIR